MDQEKGLSVYREIACLDEQKTAVLVQHRYSLRLFVKKVLSVYTLSVYRHLQAHPIDGMPQITELSENDGRLTVIEEYLAGNTLQEVLDNEGTMEAARAVSLMVQLCRIIEALHGQTPPIIHRDIKPENVILSPDGCVKLLDMNAAKWYDGSESRDTRLIGTVGYAAPEQYGFAGSSVQTDIYALGVLLNRMLTGCLPGERLSEGSLGKIVRRCIELSPKDRYGSVRELEKALLRFSTALRKQQNAAKDWHRFLPPGFRTGNVSHILLALIGYAFLLILVLNTAVKGASGFVLLADRLGIGCICALLVLLNNNYLGIHDRLPLTRSGKKWVQLCGLLLYDTAIVLTVLFLLLLVEDV